MCGYYNTQRNCNPSPLTLAVYRRITEYELIGIAQYWRIRHSVTSPLSTEKWWRLQDRNDASCRRGLLRSLLPKPFTVNLRLLPYSLEVALSLIAISNTSHNAYVLWLCIHSVMKPTSRLLSAGFPGFWKRSLNELKRISQVGKGRA